MEATVSDVVAVERMQQIEVNRRQDVALGLLPQAARLFETRKELADQIGDGKKALASKWYWAIGAGGVVGHYVFAADSHSFSLGLLLAVGAFAHWVLRDFEQTRLKDRHYQSTLRLGDLETIWVGATGYTTFWELERFAEFGQIDVTEDDFQDFWRTQMDWIRERANV